MVNPGAFKGSRKEFLLSAKEEYSAGVDGGYAADALANIQRRYFKRYPVDLPHDEEPSAESLASVDDNAPDEEYKIPDENEITSEEYGRAIERYQEYQKTLTFRKAQIKRWFAYQYMKDHDIDPSESGVGNPYNVLLHKLTGITLKRPRLKTPANVWRCSHRVEVETEVRHRAESEGTSGKQLAALREKVAKELYHKLSEIEKIEWMTQAREEHEAATAEWNAIINAPPSTAPADRQRCIQGLVRFVQPILDLVSDATGLKTTFMAGGPEPAHDGRLNIISVHSGTTPGDVKMNFGRAERVRYRKYIVPIFGSFLQKCYTPEECRARALPREEGFESLETMDLDAEGASFDTFDLNYPNPDESQPPSPSTTTIPQPNQTVAQPPSAPAVTVPSATSSAPSQPPSQPPSLVPSPAPSPASLEALESTAAASQSEPTSDTGAVAKEAGYNGLAHDFRDAGGGDE
ncbi:hypothetical protein NLJ89_g11466 [Agrocybe chaxingu]|uniref:Uncharacterized protein n=1 Tax=Agrocybe chaxingu TaxID=84603 RepID=A0A9W8JPC1_9AGAR|nr:hypothetical protein NLJ89_g11466 [Agrocybe chaxingu]